MKLLFGLRRIGCSSCCARHLTVLWKHTVSSSLWPRDTKMGCDCSKAREKELEQIPKETLSRCMARSLTMKGTSPKAPLQAITVIDTFAADLIKTQPLAVSYRVVAALRDDGNTALLHVQHIGTQQQCFVKRVKKASGRALLHQKAKLSAEAERLSKLDHPQVLRTLDVLQDDEYVYTVSEAFPGGQLQDYLSDSRLRKENVASKVMYQVFRALCYCHHSGVIHGQLSLGSLVMADINVDEDIKIKLTGFGELDALPCKPTSGDRAPEDLQSFNEKCDIWSCGIILSQILNSDAPFRVTKRSSQRLPQPTPPSQQHGTPATVQLETLRTWTVGRVGGKGRTSAVLQPCKDINEEMNAFLEQMLSLNPQLRPSAADCLKHPWIQAHNSPPIVKMSSFNTCLFNLRSLKKWSPLQEGVFKFIVTRIIREKELELYINMFYAADVDGDGAIEEEELKKQFTKVMGEVEAATATKRVMKAMDHRGSGAITFSEFLISCWGQRKLMTESNLRTVFNSIDAGTGTVKVDDLSSAFFIKRTAEKQRQWREFIQANYASDDCVTFPQFCALLNASFS